MSDCPECGGETGNLDQCDEPDLCDDCFRQGAEDAAADRFDDMAAEAPDYEWAPREWGGR